MAVRPPLLKARLMVQALEARVAPATFTVTNPTDSGNNTLRQAVLDANATPGADLIRFEIPTLQPGPLTIVLTQGEIAITDSLTINGANFGPTTPPPNAQPMIIVSGNNASRIFNVNGPGTLSVNFQVLGFTAGKSSASGGAVFNVGENLRFTSCSLTGNEAAGNGGAVASAGLNAASNVEPHVTIDYCRISDNRADDGGALHFAGPTNVSIRSSSFVDNMSDEEGGAIALAAGGRITIESSTLANNTADTFGGGLYFRETRLLAPTPIAVNTMPVVIRNSTISGNQSKVAGGGIELIPLRRNIALITNSTITNNSAGINSPILTSSGGGIHVAATTSNVPGQITLISSITSKNQAVFGPDIFTHGRVYASSSALGSIAGIGNFVDGGNNLPFGIDLKLGPLQNNGGTMLTHLPAADSPLVNHGSNPFGLQFDQRGYPFNRTVGGVTDIGAVERQS